MDVNSCILKENQYWKLSEDKKGLVVETSTGLGTGWVRRCYRSQTALAAVIDRLGGIIKDYEMKDGDIERLFRLTIVVRARVGGFLNSRWWKRWCSGHGDVSGALQSFENQVYYKLWFHASSVGGQTIKSRAWLTSLSKRSEEVCEKNAQKLGQLLLDSKDVELNEICQTISEILSDKQRCLFVAAYAFEQGVWGVDQEPDLAKILYDMADLRYQIYRAGELGLVENNSMRVMQPTLRRCLKTADQLYREAEEVYFSDRCPIGALGVYVEAAERGNVLAMARLRDNVVAKVYGSKEVPDYSSKLAQQKEQLPDALREIDPDSISVIQGFDWLARLLLVGLHDVNEALREKIIAIGQKLYQNVPPTVRKKVLFAVTQAIAQKINVEPTEVKEIEKILSKLPEEDTDLARAIRASLEEQDLSSQDEDKEKVLSKHPEEDTDLKRAIRASLEEQDLSSQDEEIKRALAESRKEQGLDAAETLYQERICATTGLQLRPTPDDGDCLFAACLEDEGERISSDLRRAVYDHMKANKQEFQDVIFYDLMAEAIDYQKASNEERVRIISKLPKSVGRKLQEFAVENILSMDSQMQNWLDEKNGGMFDSYINEMSEKKLYAGGGECLALSQLLKRPIKVYSRVFERPLDFCPSGLEADDKKTIHLYYDARHRHYMRLEKRES